MSTGRCRLTRFILVRHGETEWNLFERFRGRADLSLNETGFKQAEAAGLSLKGRRVSAIYFSPLKRTAQTAGVISRHLGVPAEPLEGLIDMDFGEFQGLSAEEAAKRDAKLLTSWIEAPHEARFPGGESLADGRERVTSAVGELAAKHDGETLVLVSHKVVCQVTLCAMLGMDNSHFWQVGQDVCAINRFEIRDGMPAVSLINDTCHLRDLHAE